MKIPKELSKLNKEIFDFSQDFKSELDENQKKMFIAYSNKRSFREDMLRDMYLKHFKEFLLKEIHKVVPHVSSLDPIYNIIENIETGEQE